MPQKLDKFPTPKRKWEDYAQYFDGRVYLFKQGVDFNCTLNSFRTFIIKSAHDAGFKVQTTTTGPDSIAVQAYIRYEPRYGDRQEIIGQDLHYLVKPR